MKQLLLLGAALLLGTRALAQMAAPAGPAAASLEFIENKGQWDAHARYAAPLPGGRLFAEADGLTFALLANGGPALLGHGARPAPPPADQALRGHALTLRFVGAAAAATLRAETPTAEHRNYFLGADARHWARDVRGYRELRYQGLWPGVNARLYESADQHLEYDFELAPGAAPAAIGLRHDGADGLALDAAGNLQVKTSVGTLTELAPRAWQLDAAGRPQAVACRYVLTGATLSFALGPYDHSRALTIDPVVVFSTYSGSTADNWGFTATYDNAGNLYSGGIAFSAGYPTSPGAFQTTFAALIDIALIKYNTAATGPAARVWATYLGGNSAEFPHSLVVNNQGELLVLGSTGSTDYPTTAGAFQRAFAGGLATSPLGYSAPYDCPNGSDIVITRLNAAGSALVGSTYLGGSGNDGLLPLSVNNSPYGGNPQLAHNYGDPFRGDIQVDVADNVYIATHTTSTNFPMARGFSSSYHGGTSDGVVCKLTPALTALTWGSYLGGSGADAAYSIQLEATTGDVYVAGGTNSSNFPVTTGAYLTTRPGDIDGFVARISAAGTGLLRASYVGTADYDQAYFLQLGTDGGVYLLGQTLGAFPVTPGLYNTPQGTQFIQKLDANLGQSQLAMVFGSTAPVNTATHLISLNPTAFLVDRCDRVYVCGWDGMVNAPAFPYLEANGYTTGLPLTPDAVQSVTDGSDFYLAQFSAGLTGLAYATYYGNPNPSSEGEHVDGGTSRFDPRGIVYQSVCSCFSNTGFPIPPGANTYSTTNNSNSLFGTGCNNAAFVLNFQPSVANAGADQTVCATAGPQALTGSPAGGVWSGPGVSGSAATGFVFTPSLSLLGVQTLTYTVASTGVCTTTGTRRITVTAPPVVTFAPLAQTTYCTPPAGQPPLPAVPLVATPAGGVFSGPGVSGSAATGFLFSPNLPAGTVQLVYTLNANNCLVQATQTVVINPQANAGADQTVCAAAGPQALTGSPAGGVWSGPGVSGSAATGFIFTPTPALLGVQTLTYTLNGNANCAGTRRVTVTAAPVATFAPLPQSVYCVGPAAPAVPPVPLAATPAGGVFTGPGVSGDATNGYFFTPTTPGVAQLVYTLSANGCAVQATQTVTVATAASAGPNLTLCANAGPLPLTGSPAGGVWSGPGVSGSAASGFVFTPAPALAGANVLTYALSSTGACSSTRVVTVALPATAAFTSALQPVYCLPAAGQPPLPAVPLVAAPAGGVFSGPGVSGSPATGFVFSPNLPAGTVQLQYTVTVNSCVLQASQTVTLKNPPTATAGPDTVLCIGSTQPFALRGAPAGGVFSGPGVSGSAATGFLFSPPAGFVGPATLTYTVTDGGCPGSATKRISVAPVPALVATWTAAACAETRLTPLTLHFALSGTGIPTSPSLTWEFGDGEQSAELTPTHTYTTPGTYQARVRVRYNADRCEAQALAPPVEVLERKIPNVITPNDDGLNQTFRLGPDCPPRLQVFSRWGQLVYEAATYHDDWSAAGQPSGVYYYLITYPDGRRVKGWVEVIR